MFRQTASGFQLELPNGYTVSVQHSGGHMCSLKNRPEASGIDINARDCPNAETAVMDTVTNEFMPIDGEDVQGYQNIDAFIKLLNDVRDYPNTDSKMAEVKERAMSNA